MPENENRQKLIVSADVKGRTYEIDLLNLRQRDLIAIEEHMDMPFPRIRAEGWISSHKVLTFAVYLAVERKDPTFTLDELYDIVDEDDSFSTDVRAEGPGVADDEDESEGEDEKPKKGAKSKRPTGTQQTTGSQS